MNFVEVIAMSKNIPHELHIIDFLLREGKIDQEEAQDMRHYLTMI